MMIKVSRSACVGAGQCVLVADDLFDQDDEGLVVLLDEEPADSRAVAAQKAASLCPARAIQLHD